MAYLYANSYWLAGVVNRTKRNDQIVDATTCNMAHSQRIDDENHENDAS